MPSKSFGEWYENQKKTPVLQSAQGASKSWFSSFTGRSETSSGDVESVGLLSHARNTGARIAGAGDAIKEAVVFFVLAGVFFLLAFFIGLPTLVMRPAKFTISFTMGSLLTMAGLARMQGVSQFLHTVFQPDRILKTILYIISLLLSILCAVVKRSYIGTMVSSIFQIAMLVLFVLDFLPMGSKFQSILVAAVRKIFSLVKSIVMRFFK